MLFCGELWVKLICKFTKFKKSFKHIGGVQWRKYEYDTSTIWRYFKIYFKIKILMAPLSYFVRYKCNLKHVLHLVYFQDPQKQKTDPVLASPPVKIFDIKLSI